MSLLTEVKFYSNGKASAHAERLWLACSEREKRFLLWDVTMEDKKRLLATALAASVYAGIAWRDGYPLAFAWVLDHGRQAMAGAIHFMFMDRTDVMGIARNFLNMLRMAGMLCVTAFVPIPFRAARNLAVNLGFTSMGIIPGACALPGRAYGGELFKLEF